ncbi:glycosyltransferase [Halorussus salinisoli]|uniref:glycosyltransferase n=1 Tax=Halorussus salinisoli TaxID=2558242 RepID=UPI001484D31E|nr:glycosyltransferase [Halorussus salinisoli]
MSVDDISIFIPSFSVGGAEQMAINLSSEFADMSVNVELVVARNKGGLAKKVGSNVSVEELEFDIDKFPLPFCVRRLSQYIDDHRPDIVLSLMKHTNITAISAKLLASHSPTMIVSERNHISRSLNQHPIHKRKTLKNLMRILYPYADHIIAISEGVSKSLQDEIRVQEKKISVIYNPVVTNKLLKKATEPIDHHWFQNEQTPVVLGVGRLHPQKNFETLLKAFALVRSNIDAKLLILGEGKEREKLKTLAEDLGIEEYLCMPGNVDNPYKYMSQSSVFVLSSAWEGFGNVIVEALACECPVVSTDCHSGPSEILARGEYGRLVPVRDEGRMAEAITQTINGDKIPDNKLKNRSMDFQSDNIAKKYLDIISDSRSIYDEC